MARAQHFSNSTELEEKGESFTMQKRTAYAVGGLAALLLLLFAWLAFDGKGAGKGISGGPTSADVPVSGSLGTGQSGLNGQLNVEQVIEKVSKHFAFPANTGEVVVVVVTDIRSLQKAHPGWYDRAKTGDLLLAYSEGMIIFDPKEEKIVDLLRFVEQK